MCKPDELISLKIQTSTVNVNSENTKLNWQVNCCIVSSANKSAAKAFWQAVYKPGKPEPI